LLARIGIGHLVVVDHDVFDETNLNRQALSSTDAIGRSKSDQAASTVKSVNPGVEVTSYPIRIEPSNANEILRGSNVVVDALDNVHDRLVLQEEAEKLNIPLVHGALAGFEGQVMTVFPGDRGMKLLYGNAKKEGADPKSPEAILGVPTFTPSFVATLQAMEVLKIILNRGKLLRHTMLHVDLENASLNKFSFSETE
jgi:molybdopterin/thiamine biosynthesis adenylyltransferase